MAYQFDFVPVLANTDLLLRGALFTLELTAIGALLGVAWASSAPWCGHGKSSRSAGSSGCMSS